VLPFCYEWAPILLPFAIGNGIASGISYGVIDITTASKAFSNPLSGGFIGGFTGLLAPAYLYAPAFRAIYGEDVSEFINGFLSFPYVMEISCTTGVFAGLAIYPVLYYPIHGVKGIPWYNFSLPVCLSSIFLCYYLYSPFDDGLPYPAPDESYVQKDQIPLLSLIWRYNPNSSVLEEYTLSGKGSWLSKEVKKRNSIDHDTDLVQEGLKLRQLIQTRASSNLFDWTPEPTFDSRKVSFLYYTFASHECGDLEEKYAKHIVPIRSELGLNERQSAIFATDCLMEFLVCRQKSAVRHSAIRDTRNHLNSEMSIVRNVFVNSSKDMNRASIGFADEIDEIQLASAAAYVWWMLLHKNKDPYGSIGDKEKSKILMKSIESELQLLVPNIILRRSDERTGETGISIQNRLCRNCDWIVAGRGERDDMISAAMKEWSQAKSLHTQNKRRNLVIKTALGGFLGGLMWFYSNS